MKRFLRYLQRTEIKMSRFHLWFIRLLKRVSDILGRENHLDVFRFYLANSLESSILINEEISIDKKSTVDLVIVSAAKDFDILSKSVVFGKKSLGDFYSGLTYIAVPESDLKSLPSSCVNSDLVLLSEDEVISSDDRNKLRSKFGARYGWALQQFLKVQLVIQSKNQAALVLDSDTILLKPRKWFDSQGRQLLFPSWEFQKSYYELLNTLGVSSKVPKYTFISHHMLMQKKYLESAICETGASDISDLISLVVKNAASEKSAFCIEYELYGQFMQNFHRSALFTEKWGNLNVRRSELLKLSESEMQRLYNRYSSISAHDYL